MHAVPTSKEFFTDVLKSQLSDLSGRGFNFQYNPLNTKVAVIVEPREHELLAAVIQNVMFFLGDSWNLQIFTGRGKKAWVCDEVLKLCGAKVSELEVENLAVHEYSALLMNREFWDSIAEPNILIFQTDCIMLRNGIGRFVGYDFAGANYFKRRDMAPMYGGIQGGFSLRSKQCMLDCIRDVSENDVNDYRRMQGFDALQLPLAEDVFFTHACEILGKFVVPAEERKHFSIEAEFFEKPIAFHGFVHDYFDHEHNKKLVM